MSERLSRAVTASKAVAGDRDRGCSAETRDDGRDEVGYSPSLKISLPGQPRAVRVDYDTVTCAASGSEAASATSSSSWSPTRVGSSQSSYSSGASSKGMRS